MMLEKKKMMGLFLIATLLTVSKPIFATQGIEPLAEATIKLNIIEKKPSISFTKDWKRFFKRHISTLFAASFGTLMGAICAWVEKKDILPMPISWLFFFGTRSFVVHLLMEDMERHNIPHNKKLALEVAKIADWLTYLTFIHWGCGKT